MQRTDYWISLLGVFVFMILGNSLFDYGEQNQSFLVESIGMFLVFYSCWNHISITIKRLHDTKYSRFFVLLLFVPIPHLDWIVSAILGFIPSEYPETDEDIVEIFK